MDLSSFFNNFSLFKPKSPPVPPPQVVNKVTIVSERGNGNGNGLQQVSFQTGDPNYTPDREGMKSEISQYLMYLYYMRHPIVRPVVNGIATAVIRDDYLLEGDPMEVALLKAAFVDVDGKGHSMLALIANMARCLAIWDELFLEIQNNKYDFPAKFKSVDPWTMNLKKQPNGEPCEFKGEDIDGPYVQVVRDGFTLNPRLSAPKYFKAEHFEYLNLNWVGARDAGIPFLFASLMNASDGFYNMRNNSRLHSEHIPDGIFEVSDDMHYDEIKQALVDAKKEPHKQIICRVSRVGLSPDDKVITHTPFEKPTDMQYKEHFDSSNQMVMSSAQTPPLAVGILDKSFQSIADVVMQFYEKNVIMPYRRELENLINERIIKKRFKFYKVTFKFGADNTRDLILKGQAANQMSPFFTRDEIRKKVFNEEPIDNEPIFVAGVSQKQEHPSTNQRDAEAMSELVNSQQYKAIDQSALKDAQFKGYD